MHTAIFAIQFKAIFSHFHHTWRANPFIPFLLYSDDRVCLLVLIQRLDFNQEFVKCPGIYSLQIIRDNTATHKS